MYASNVCRRVSNDFSSKGSVLVIRVDQRYATATKGMKEYGVLSSLFENWVGPFERYRNRVGTPKNGAHKRKRCVRRTHLVSRKSSKTRNAKNLTSIGCFRSPVGVASTNRLSARPHVSPEFLWMLDKYSRAC